MLRSARAEAAGDSQGMNQMARKQRYFESYAIQKDRLPDGQHPP